VLLERAAVDGGPAVRIVAEVTNRRDGDVAVVTPTLGRFTDSEDGATVVRADTAELEGAPVGDAEDAGDAPPTVPGVIVSSGDSADPR
jgi:hypothetical protein